MTRSDLVVDAHGAAARKLLERFCGDVEMFRAVAEVFLEDYPRRLAQIKDARRTRNAVAMHQAAHSLKGAVGTFVDNHAFVTAARLEALARANDLAETGALCNALGQQLYELEAAIRLAMRQG